LGFGGSLDADAVVEAVDATCVADLDAAGFMAALSVFLGSIDFLTSLAWPFFLVMSVGAVATFFVAVVLLAADEVAVFLASSVVAFFTGALVVVVAAADVVVDD